jgi:hypothetical protein
MKILIMQFSPANIGRCKPKIEFGYHLLDQSYFSCEKTLHDPSGFRLKNDLHS